MSKRNRTGKSIGQDIPSLIDTLLRVVDSSGGLSPFGDRPFALLWAHLRSLNDVCQQALYAMERLSVLVSEPPETPSYLREQYHLWGFLSRVKTGTDLVALILNVVFELGLPEGDCSLEKVRFSRALRRRANARHGAAAGELADTLDRARNDWIEPFYKVRNLVIHRNGLELVRAPHPQSHESHAFVAPAGLLATAGDRQVVERLLRQLGLVQVPLACTTVIEPVNLCELLWARLAALVNAVLVTSGRHIDHFVSEQSAGSEGNTWAADDGETGG